MVNPESRIPSAQAAQPSFDQTLYSAAKQELQTTGFQFLLGLHQFKGDELVVDLACGDGGATVNDLCSRVANGKVYGVDISAGMIAAASELRATNAEFFVGDIEALADVKDLKIEPQSVDVFVSNYGMHWVLGRERMQAFLKQVYNLTKPGGILLSLFAEEQIFPGFFERMHEVMARDEWRNYFDNGTFKHHPLPAIQTFGEDVQIAGFKIEILKLREGWITFDNAANLVRGVLGWLPQYMNKLPHELRAKFATEVVDHYAQSTSSIKGYPNFEDGKIGVYDISIVLKATK